MVFTHHQLQIIDIYNFSSRLLNLLLNEFTQFLNIYWSIRLNAKR